MGNTMKRKCVFFDRDGIVNKSPGLGYVERWQDFYLFPEFVESARIAVAKGYAVAIATNQRGVALGIMTQETLDDMHAKLREILLTAGVSLLGIFCCVHERNSCDCRKPLPGLLLQAKKAHDIDLAASWMIGDRETDVDTGRAAGCRTVLVGVPDTDSNADFRVVDMAALPAMLECVL